MPKFIVTNRKTNKSETLVLNKDSILIGRRGKNDISLDSETISRKHAEIIRLKGDYYIVDLESGNGTLLNSKPLKPHEKNLLSDSDVARVEEFEVKFLATEDDHAFLEDQTDSGIIEIKMIKKVLSALDVEALPRLEGISPETKGKKVTLTDDLPELSIGRDDTCQFSLDSNVVSRKHAILTRKWGGITITDNDSKNGTYVNNRKIKETTLKDGDIITLGTIKFLFRNPQDIDMEALARDYESKAEPALSTPPPEEKPQESISSAAKMTVPEPESAPEANAKEEPKKEVKEEAPKPAEEKAEEKKEKIQKEEEPKKEEPKNTETKEESVKEKKQEKPKLKFGTLEIVMMAAGACILVGALGLIAYLL